MNIFARTLAKASTQLAIIASALTIAMPAQAVVSSLLIARGYDGTPSTNSAPVPLNTTAGFDAAAGNGNDTGGQNGIVRVNDDFSYDAYINHSLGGESNVTVVAVLSGAPVVAKWAFVPLSCNGASSNISADGLTLTCIRTSMAGPLAANTSLVGTFVAQVVRGAVNAANIPVPTFTVTSASTPVAVVGVGDPAAMPVALSVSAGPLYDIIATPGQYHYISGFSPLSDAAGTQDGYIRDVNFAIVAKGGRGNIYPAQSLGGPKGTEQLNTSAPITATVDMSAHPAGTTLLSWVTQPNAEASDGCVTGNQTLRRKNGASAADGTDPYPYPLEVGAGNTDLRFIRHAANAECNIDSTSGGGSIVNVSLTGVDSTFAHIPTVYQSGGAIANNNTFIANRKVLFWIPYSALPPNANINYPATISNFAATTLSGQAVTDVNPANNVENINYITSFGGASGKRPHLDTAVLAPIRAPGNPNMSGDTIVDRFAPGQRLQWDASFYTGSLGSFPGPMMVCDKLDNARTTLVSAVASYGDATGVSNGAVNVEYGVGGNGITGFVPGVSGGTWTSYNNGALGYHETFPSPQTSTHATATCLTADATWFNSEAALFAAGYQLKDVSRIRAVANVTTIGPQANVSVSIKVQANSNYAFPVTELSPVAKTYALGDPTTTPMQPMVVVPNQLVGGYNNTLISSSRTTTTIIQPLAFTEIYKTSLSPVNTYAGTIDRGTVLQYQLQPRVTTPYPVVPTTVEVTDVLPPYLSYVVGSASIAPNSIAADTPAAGFTTLKWVLPATPVQATVTSGGGALTPITFSALVSQVVPSSHTLRNNTTIHAVNDFNTICPYVVASQSFTPCGTYKTSQKSFVTSNIGGYALAKEAVKSPLTMGEAFSYRVQFAAITADIPNVPRVLDIFPFVAGHRGATVGDGTADAGLNRAARTPASAFTAGSTSLTALTAPATGGTFYYTSAAPDAINADPYAAANTTLPGGIWCAAPGGAGVSCPATLGVTTAYIFVSSASPLTAASGIQTIGVDMAAPTSTQGNKFTNGVYGNNDPALPGSLSMLTQSAVIEVNASSLAGRNYFDANNNGVFEPAIDTQLTNVRMRLTCTSGPCGSANYTVRTDAAGQYAFIAGATNVYSGAGAGALLSPFPGLSAGTYSLVQEDPNNVLVPYSDGPDQPGNAAGTAGGAGTSQITNIVIPSGYTAVSYDFLETKHDFTLNKTGPTQAQVGSPFNYAINVRNAGGGDSGAIAYEVIDDIDTTKFQFNSVLPTSSGGWTCASAAHPSIANTTRVRCTSTTNIAASGVNTTPIIINVTPLSAAATSPITGIQNNTAIIAITTLGVTDGVATNNSSTWPTTVTGVTDLRVTKTAATNTASVGQPYSWTLSVRNDGSAATNLVVGQEQYVVRDLLDTAKFTAISAAGTNWACTNVAAGAPDPDAGKYGIAPGATVAAGKTLVRCVNTGVAATGNPLAAGAANPNNITLTATPTSAALGTNLINTARVDGGNEVFNSPEYNNNTGTHTYNVVQFATVTKAFAAPSTIQAGASIDLVFTITNPINNIAQSGLGFTDTLPAGLKIANPNGLANACGGTVTANSATSIITLVGGNVGAGTATATTCTITVKITNDVATPVAACPAPATRNADTNISNLVSLLNGVPTASAVAPAPVAPCLTVVAAPTLTKSFTPAGPVAAGTPVVMTFVLGNPANNPAMTDAGFTDTLPAGMVFSPAAPTLGGTCASTSGAALVRSVAGAMLTVSGVDIAASGASATTCTVTVTSVVIGAANQSLINTTSAPTATVGGIPVTGLVATAPLATTTANPPTISKAFGAASIQAGGTTTLTITLSNNNLVPAVLSSALVDTFPTTPGAMTLANNIVGGTCTTANVTATTGAGQLSYNTNGVIPAATAIGTPGTCTIIVNVTAPVAGTYVNNITAGALGTNVGVNPAPAQATLVVNNAPTIAKSFNPTAIAANGTSKLTITLTNNNPTVATLTSNLDDVISASGFTFTSVDAAASTCTGTKSLPNATTVRYASGATIPAASGGTAGTCTIVVNTTGTTAGTLTNTIPADALVTDKGNNPAPAVATLTVTNAPTVAKAFSPNTIKAGDVSQLTITLTNNNPTAATLTTPFTDTLPPGVTLANTNFGGSCGPASVSGSAGGNTVTYAQNATIPGGAPGSCTITANVTSTASGAYTNTILANTLQTTNGNYAANATAPLTVLVPPTITKAFAPTSIAPGAVSTMTLVLTNPNVAGTPNLTGVSVSDSLPAGMVLLSAPAATASPAGNCGTFTATPATGVISIAAANMAPAAVCTITAAVTMTAPNSTLNNTTSAPMATGPVALTGTTATAPLTTTTSTAPTVAKSFNPVNIPVGGTSVLTITLTNNNLVPAVLSAALEDMLPPGVTVANTVFGGSCIMLPPLNGNSNTISAAAGDTSVFYTANSYIPPSTVNGGTCNLQVTVTSSTPGAKVNVIDPGKLQTNMGNNNTVASATMSVVAPPTVTKTISPSPINIGAPSTMTITITNPAGNVALTSVGITDTLPGVAPNDMTFVNNTVGGTCTGTTKSIAGNVLTFAGGTLAAESSCTLTSTVTIKAGSTTLTNTTTAPTATGGTGAGITVAGNTANADLTTNPAVAPTLAKAFTPATIQTGGVSVLSITVTNNNAVAATLSSALTDALPAGVTVASPVGFATTAGCSAAGAGPAAGATGSVTVLPANAVVAAGAPGTCVVSFNVTSTTGGTVTNTIPVGALATNNGSNPTAATAPLTVLLPPTVAKSFSPTSIPVNGVSTLTITLTNPNATTATLSAPLTDNLPANVVLAASPAPSSNCTNASVVGLPGSTAVTLQAGASIPGGTPSGVCTITAYVTSSVASATAYVNTIPLGSLQTNNGNQATVANASLTVTSPLLALTKSAPSPALAVGATSTYTLTVTNTGNGAATVAAIKESIPANMQYTGFAGAGWTCPEAPITGATTIDCTYAGSIAATGGTTALTVDMKPLTAAAIPATGVTNKASVGTTGGTSVPVDPTTCTAAAVGASNTALPTAGCASNTALVQAIDVVKSVNTAATKSGPLSFDVPYKVIVKSTGSAAATNFQAVENLATTFATGSPTLAWVAGSAPTVLAATGGATAGQCVLNAGFVAAPSATNMFSGNQSLPTGGACEVTFTVRVTYPSAAVIPAAAQNNSVVATSSATTGGTPLATDTSTTGTATPVTPNGDTPLVTSVLLPLNPVLSLVKGAPTPALAVGVESTYPLTVSNTGNLIANAATIQEAIPASTQYTGFAGTGWACLPAAPATGPVAVTCTFTGAGAAGIAAISGTSVLSIKVKPLAAAAGTTVTNKASVDPTGGTTPPSATTCTALNTPTAGCAAPRSDDIQTIDVVKSLNTAVTVVNGNTFDVPYKVIVKNVGATVAATNFQAVESLATTFATGTPTLAWTSVALQPTVTAVAPATAAQCLLNPAFVSAPSATNMFDGRQTLPAGGACSVTFTVRVTYASPAAVPTATTQDNSVTATTYTTAPAAAGGTGTGVVVSDVSTNSAISPATPGADTASVTPVSLVILPADLSIQKNGPAMITNGGALVYTLTVRNAGPGVANGATYLDTLPAGLTAVSASCGAPTAGASCAVPTVTGVASVSGTVPMLPAGGSVTITINATAPAAGLTALVNTSSVASPAGIPDPTPSNNTSSVTTNIVTVLPKQADISIVKTGATTVAPSGVMSYLLTVTNAGPGAANGSTVADAVPATVTGIAATCVSATGGASCTAATVSGNNVAATIATLPANATVVYQITGTAPASGTVVNTATVKVPVGITDPNPANNSSTATSTIGAITGNANVAVIKTGDTSAPVNGTVTYKITVSNAGPDAANGTQLSDIVPAELSNVAASCGVATGGAVCAAPSVAANTVTATIATLPANSTVTYTITAKAPATPARFSNSATVTLPPGIADPNPSDNVGGPVITQITGGAAVSGTVYKDANRNNVKDAAELPVAGIVVTLRNAAGTVIGTTTTDAKGNYTFANVPAGTGYSVVFNYGTSPQGVASPTGTANDPLSGNANGLQSITGITVLNDNVTLDQNARLVDPSGVVYDAITRKPVAGATVCLAANGTLVTNAQLSPATPNCQVTDATGAYTFFINATAPTGAYTLQVTQPAGYLPPNAVQGGVSLPSAAGYNVPAAPGVSAIQAQAVAPTGAQPTTYYFLFNNFGPASQDVIQNHIPLDPIANAKLLVIKTAAKATAEVGDSMTYTITVKRTDTAAGALPSFVVVDTLPVGFTYIPGTAMVNGATVTDASIGLAAQGSKPVMNMAFTTPLSAGQQMSLTYRVRIGVGAAEGSGTNRASAKYNAGIDCAVEPNKCSNEARATVKVTAGVFTPQACVIGKVYADCNKNGIQDNEEMGIPGVKLYMLDGTSIITDVEGKYSICDLKPQTGVLAVDRSTMPRGSLFGTTSNRNALDGSSLFIDLKKGEMHRADFSEASCSNGVLEQIKSRRAQGEVRAAETEKSRALTQPSLNYQAKPVADPIQTTDGANQPAINVRQNNRQ